MKTRIIAGAIVLGLGAVTFALARQEAGKPVLQPSPAGALATRPSERPAIDPSELHAAVAQLRAEVEVLQLEHDLARERLSIGLRERAAGVAPGTSQQSARGYMRIGAEVVGKGSDFEAAMQEKGDEIWREVTKSVAPLSQAEIDHLKQDFLRVTTELNRKKIDLIGLETRLEGSM
jgi:hypothetical protein